MQRLKHGDLIALFGQVAGAGQARRAGTHDGHLVAVGLGLGGSLGAVGVVPVGHKTLQTADTHGVALLAADAVHLALGLLRADAAAHGGQGAGLMDHLISALIVLLHDLLDELRDAHVDGTAVHAEMVLAVEAAGGFVQRLLLGVAQRYLEEVFIADIGVLRGHLVLLQAHIRHDHFTSCLYRLQTSSCLRTSKS